MIVQRKNFQKALNTFKRPGIYGLDTETTGLTINARPFSIILANDHESFYFNFQEYDGIGEEFVLDESHLEQMQVIFSEPKSTFCAHNAYFDHWQIYQAGIKIESNLWCTLLGSRIEKNTHMKHSLDAAGARIGYEKSDAVEDYIKEHKLWEWVDIPFKKKRVKNKFYWKVPLDVIAPYGEKDAQITRALGIHQFQKIREMKNTYAKQGHICKFYLMLQTEKNIPKVCSAMFRRGVKVDLEYTRTAMEHELKELETLKHEFSKETGTEWEDSPKTMLLVFRLFDWKLQRTTKGNFSFDDKTLSKIEHPLCDLILKIRSLEKRISTYFSSILYHQKNGFIHAGIRPGGTVTGRFSYSDPNLQNIPKKEDGQFQIRKCLVPRKDHIFVMIDYDQQELKLLFDYANETELIRRVKNGEDGHQVTSELAGITRPQAKTINFGLIYGMGINELANKLGTTVEQAKIIKNRHISSLKGIDQFIKRVKSQAINRGYIVNWAGRRYHLDDPSKSYVMVNHLIQGSGADVCRKAMVDCFEYLKAFRSALLLQVHDELLFEVHIDELSIVPDLKNIMEKAYIPRNGLPLTCSVEYSLNSWGEKKEWPTNPKQILNLRHKQDSTQSQKLGS